MAYEIQYCGYAENEPKEQELLDQEQHITSAGPYLRWGLPGSKCILTIVQNAEAGGESYRLYVIFPQEAWQGGVSEEELKHQAQDQVRAFLEGHREGWQPRLDFPNAFEMTVLTEDSALT